MKSLRNGVAVFAILILGPVLARGGEPPVCGLEHVHTSACLSVTHGVPESSGVQLTQPVYRKFDCHIDVALLKDEFFARLLRPAPRRYEAIRTIDDRSPIFYSDVSTLALTPQAAVRATWSWSLAYDGNEEGLAVFLQERLEGVLAKAHGRRVEIDLRILGRSTEQKTLALLLSFTPVGSSREYQAFALLHCCADVCGRPATPCTVAAGCAPGGFAGGGGSFGGGGGGLLGAAVIGGLVTGRKNSAPPMSPPAPPVSPPRKPEPPKTPPDKPEHPADPDDPFDPRNPFDPDNPTGPQDPLDPVGDDPLREHPADPADPFDPDNPFDPDGNGELDPGNPFDPIGGDLDEVPEENPFDGPDPSIGEDPFNLPGDDEMPDQASSEGLAEKLGLDPEILKQARVDDGLWKPPAPASPSLPDLDDASYDPHGYRGRLLDLLSW